MFSSIAKVSQSKFGLQLLNSQMQRQMIQSGIYAKRLQIPSNSMFSSFHASLSSEMNEIFTEEEMSTQKDPHEEISSLHREFNERFFQTIEQSLQTRFSSASSIDDETIDSINSLNSNTNSAHPSLLNNNKGHFNWNTLTSNNQNNNSHNNNSHSSNHEYNINQLQGQQHQQNQHQQGQPNSSRNITQNNLQSTVRRMKQAYSPSEKLMLAGQYCKQVKMQMRDIDQKQRTFLSEYLAPTLQTIQEDPSKYDNSVLFSVLNISREDFVNVPLSANVIACVKRAILETYTQLDIDSIKYLFYASSNRHKDTTATFIDAQVIRCWLNLILTRIKTGETSERELILFITCYTRDSDLYRKTHKFIAQMICKAAQQDGLLLNARNAELLKVLVTTFTRNETCSQQMLSVFVDSLVVYIDKQIITPSQFQAIFRQLLRSQSFINYRIISSYQVTTSPINTTNELNNNLTSDTDSNHTLSSENFKVINCQKFAKIDEYINKHLMEFSGNQVLNTLNLYQSVNAQNYKNTVERLLERMSDQFAVQCDNFFAFNIVARTLSLFCVQKSTQLKYIRLFKSWHKRQAELVGYQKQAANTLAIVKYCLNNSAFTKEYSRLHANILQIISSSTGTLEESNNTHEINIHSNRAYLTAATAKKREHFGEVQKLFENTKGIKYKPFSFIDSVHVDFYITTGDRKAQKQSQKQQQERVLPAKQEIEASALNKQEETEQIQNLEQNKTFIPTLQLNAFAVDIVSTNDYMIPKTKFNGSLELKYEVLQKMNVACVILSEEFCVDLFSIQSMHLQQKLLFAHINKQLLEFTKKQKNS